MIELSEYRPTAVLGPSFVCSDRNQAPGGRLMSGESLMLDRVGMLTGLGDIT